MSKIINNKFDEALHYLVELFNDYDVEKITEETETCFLRIEKALKLGKLYWEMFIEKDDKKIYDIHKKIRELDK